MTKSELKPYWGDQHAYWNSHFGVRWAELRKMLDTMHGGLYDIVLHAAAIKPGERVLEIGCGSGGMAKQAADQGGDVTGIDISEPMIAAAQLDHSAHAKFIVDDGAYHRGSVPYDLLISCIGSVFFFDPSMAYRNLFENLTPGGRFVFVTWKDVEDNLWMTQLISALKLFVPVSSLLPKEGPGAFSLTDPDQIKTLMSGAGFTEIEIKSVTLPITFAQTGGVDAAVELATKIGLIASFIESLSADDQKEVRVRLARSLKPLERNGRVESNGEVWLVTARK